MAAWLVAPAKSPTDREAANRVRQQFFGAGLVRTPEDFGVQGQWPSHLELLDWLGGEFVRSGWDVKALHQRIGVSATIGNGQEDVGKRGDDGGDGNRRWRRGGDEERRFSRIPSLGQARQGARMPSLRQSYRY